MNRRAASLTRLLVLAVGSACGAEPPSSGAADASSPLAPDAGDAGGPDGAVTPGAPLWRLEHGLQVAYGPAIDHDGTLYLQGRRVAGTLASAPTLLAVDARGELRWGADTSPASVPAPPVTLAGGTLIAPATTSGNGLGGRVHRFTSDGSALPGLPLDGPVGAAAAVTADGLLVVPASSVMAYRGQDLDWSFVMAAGGVTGTNVGVGPSGTLYVAGRGPDHSLHAIDPATGTERWRVDLGAATIDALAVDGAERIYTLNGAGALRAVDAGGGTLWTYAAADGGSGLVVGPDGTVYFGVVTLGDSEGGKWLHAVRDGALLWRASVGFLVGSTPALSEAGTLYVGNGCNTLTALRAADGTVLWRFDLPAPDGYCGGGWSSPTIAPDGTVYASGGGGLVPGALYAFAGDGTGLSQSAPWPGEQRDLAHTGSLQP